MSRDLTAGMVTEVTADVLRPIFLAEFFFTDGTVRFWNGIGDLVFGANTYTGAGSLLSLSEYEETQDLQANGITFSLSGIPSNILEIGLTRAQYYNRTCNLYIGALEEDGTLVSSPYQIFSGFMDVMEITEAGDTCQIDLMAENKMIIVNRKKDRRYTPEDQKTEYPSDLCFDFVPTMQDKEIIWKAKS